MLTALKGANKVLEHNIVQSAFNNSVEMIQRESRRSTFGNVTDKD